MSEESVDSKNLVVASSSNDTEDNAKPSGMQSCLKLKMFRLKTAMFEVFNNMKVLYTKGEIDEEGENNKIKETNVESRPNNTWSKYIPPPDLDVLFQYFPH